MNMVYHTPSPPEPLNGFHGIYIKFIQIPGSIKRMAVL